MKTLKQLFIELEATGSEQFKEAEAKAEIRVVKDWLIQKRLENQEKITAVSGRDGGTYFRERFIDKLLEELKELPLGEEKHLHSWKVRDP
jgi:hypothetical protein